MNILWKTIYQYLTNVRNVMNHARHVVDQIKQVARNAKTILLNKGNTVSANAMMDFGIPQRSALNAILHVKHVKADY